MDSSLLKKAAIQSLALMVAVVTTSFAVQQYQAVSISASAETQHDTIIAYDQGEILVRSESGLPLISDQASSATGAAVLATSLTELAAQTDKDIRKQLGENYIAIKKPAAEKPAIALEDIYINHSIQLDLTGAYESAITNDMILRVRGEDFYAGEPKYTEITTQGIEEDGSTKEVVTRDYGMDLCHGILMSSVLDAATNQYHTKLLLELDSVYAYFIYEDSNYYYIDLRKPSEVYDKILVIDPGHGGKDAGALSKDKSIYEKNINLGIAMKLKELLDQENIKVYYTRMGDDKVFLRPRVTLANAVDCDYFISIHCNSNEVTYPNGTEVLYYNNEFNGVAAKKLAKLFSEEVGKNVELVERGPVEKQMEDIFIMDQAQVPMILIELGYMSNSKDLQYLSSPEKQKEVARGIFQGIMRAYEELPVKRSVQ